MKRDGITWTAEEEALPDPEDKGGQAPDLDAFYEDPIPSCCGQVISIGNEKPDGHWILKYKWWFKCLKCNRVWSLSSPRAFRKIFSTARL